MADKILIADLGDEYYDPTRNLIFSYDRKEIKRTPNQQEIDWIVKKCGYQIDSSKVEMIEGKNDQTVVKIISNRRKNVKSK